VIRFGAEGTRDGAGSKALDVAYGEIDVVHLVGSEIAEAEKIFRQLVPKDSVVATI
jgi:hypothetical protein